jgi:hypothetical protein
MAWGGATTAWGGATMAWGGATAGVPPPPLRTVPTMAWNGATMAWGGETWTSKGGAELCARADVSAAPT